VTHSLSLLCGVVVLLPCLVCLTAGLIVARALRTIDKSQDLGLKMLKQPTHKQMDYYYSKLLGENWQKQLEQVGGPRGQHNNRHRICRGLTGGPGQHWGCGVWAADASGVIISWKSAANITAVPAYRECWLCVRALPTGSRGSTYFGGLL